MLCMSSETHQYRRHRHDLHDYARSSQGARSTWSRHHRRVDQRLIRGNFGLADRRAAPGGGLTCLISPYLPRYRRSGRKTGPSGAGGVVGGELMLAYQAPEAWWAGSLWRIATAWAQPSLPTRGWPGTGWRTR